MTDWNTIFKERGRVFHRREEHMPDVVKFLKKSDVKRVLDLGCGTGRHTVLLAKNGFDVYSMDISVNGIRMTREWLKKKGLSANVRRASIYKRFPYKSGFFDAVVSTQVIHHNYRGRVRYCISEIRRVLRPGGIIFVTVAGGSYRKRHKLSRNPRPNVFIPLDGKEAGIVHYLYTRKTLKEDFNDFSTIRLTRGKKKHLCLLARLKERTSRKKTSKKR